MKINMLLKKTRIVIISPVLFITASNSYAAGLPVLDIPHIVLQGVSWGMDAVEQYSQTAESITQTAKQIKMVEEWAKDLERLTGSEWVGLVNDTVIQSQEITNVMSSINALEYDAKAIESQINNIFPKDGDWKSFNFNNINNLRETWNNTMSDAVKGALQAQAAIKNISSRNSRVKTLLNDSENADGSVRQGQVFNQLNAALIASVNDMNQSMIATQRMFAIEQQREIAERENGQEQYARLMTNYTNRGASVSIPSSLPKIQ